MMQCFMDLCYLAHQRSTDIRLPRHAQMDADRIHFKRSKTENSSGTGLRSQLRQPSGPCWNVRGASRRSRACTSSTRWTHAQHCVRFGRSGIELCVRAGYKGITIKDIRPNALTAADAMGYSLDQIRKGAAYTTVTTAEPYLAQYRDVVSPIETETAATTAAGLFLERPQRRTKGTKLS